MGRKQKGLIDLEYMIPKEFKEQLSVDSPPEDSWEAPTYRETESSSRSCCSCGCSSAYTTLVLVVHQDLDKFMCPDCLKRELGLPERVSSTPPASSWQTQPSHSSSFQTTVRRENEEEDTEAAETGFASMFG